MIEDRIKRFLYIADEIASSLRAAQKNSDRYEWLRNGRGNLTIADGYDWQRTGAEVDALIDAEMAKEKTP